MAKKRTQLNLLIMGSLITALTAIGAWVSIPLPTPVPFTLQAFFVLTSGLLLGPKWGVLSQAAYLVLGGIGLPIFASGGAGITYLAGPTGGYLFGFVAAAWVSGVLYRNRTGFLMSLAATAAGLFCIYLLGVIQLAVVAGLSVTKAIMVGVIPFIALDAGKALAASWLVPHLCKRLEKIGFVDSGRDK